MSLSFGNAGRNGRTKEGVAKARCLSTAWRQVMVMVDVWMEGERDRERREYVENIDGCEERMPATIELGVCVCVDVYRKDTFSLVVQAGSVPHYLHWVKRGMGSSSSPSPLIGGSPSPRPGVTYCCLPKTKDGAHEERMDFSSALRV